MIKEIKISDVVVKDRKRNVDDAKVEELAESIAQIGLINNITVSADNELIAGYHRFEALKKLQHETISVNVIEVNSLEKELVEIDENLIRKELTALERSEQLQRRKEIYEIQFPDTKKGKSQAKALHKKDAVTAESAVTEEESQQESFIKNTSKKTGIPERTLFKDLQIATNLTDEVKEIIRDTPISNKKTKLLELARLPRKKQIEAAISMVKEELLSSQDEGEDGISNKVENIEELFSMLKGEIFNKNYEAVDTYSKIVKLVGKKSEYAEKLNELKPFILSIMLKNFKLENVNKMLEVGLNPFLLPSLFKKEKENIHKELATRLENFEIKEDEDKEELRHILSLVGNSDKNLPLIPAKTYHRFQ